MLLLDWTSEDMPRHYGASAAAQRAHAGIVWPTISGGTDVDNEWDFIQWFTDRHNIRIPDLRSSEDLSR